MTACSAVVERVTFAAIGLRAGPFGHHVTIASNPGEDVGPQASDLHQQFALVMRPERPEIRARLDQAMFTTCG